MIADCKKCSPATKFVVASWSICDEPLIVPAPPPPDASIFKVSLPDVIVTLLPGTKLPTKYEGLEVISEKATEPDEVRYEPVAEDK